MAILKLTQQGFPSAWISPEDAATLIVKGQMSWSLGALEATLRGGIRLTGDRSQLEIPAIIATKGVTRQRAFTPALTNRFLFRRDGYQCLYCGEYFKRSDLTRDHIVPRGQGGEDIWMNVASACKRCNNMKGCRTPDQANMPLIAVPFVPNPFEFFYLASHEIQEDQYEYLSSRWSTQRSWAA